MQPDKTRRYLRFFGARPDADVDEEIAFHLEMRAQELIARGMSPDEARAEAHRRFGDRARVQGEMRRLERDRVRRASWAGGWHTLQADLSFVVRTLVRQPLFTLSVILTLGLSIGANASIFSAVNAYLLKPMPVREADRLAVVASAERATGMAGTLSYPVYREVLQLESVFEDAVAWMGWEVALRREREAERGFILSGSENYFHALGVGAAVGRVYTAEEARRRAPVVVLTDAYWARAFDRDPGAIGQALYVNDIAFTVIGVLPPTFRGTEPLLLPDAIVPLEAMTAVDPGLPAALERVGQDDFRILAHLRPGVTIEQAREAVARLTDALAARYPENFSDVRLVAEREIRTRPHIAVSRLTPWVAGVFFGMVALALLVACANVANLLLVRATVRRSEIAIRSALGASPGRVVRLLLTESVLLGAVSLVVAYGMARVCVGWLNALPLAVDVPIAFGIELDARVFAYAAALSLVAGALSGLAPALMGAREPVGSVLRDGGRTGSAGPAGKRLRSSLVVAQVAVSFLLLVCGGLFIRSARSAAGMDLGFTRDRLLLAQTDLSLHRMDSVTARRVQDRLLESVAAVPGVERVALSSFIPMTGNFTTRTVHVDERPPRAPLGFLTVGHGSVTPGFVATLGIRLLGGRDFTPDDDEHAPPVAMVNRAMADALWPGRDPIGAQLRLERDGQPVVVVGVVDNITVVMLGELPRPMAFFPLRQQPAHQTYLVTRARGADPSALAGDLRTAVAAVHPGILLYGMRTMSALLDNGIALFFVNVGATLASAIGLLGLLQTIVGLYGVLSYTVAQRAREFGIRMALGAQAGAMIRTVLRQGAGLVAGGLLAGGTAALVLTRGLAALLVGVSPTDALTYGGALVVVAGMALLSSYIPAWRASRVEPAVVVRGE